MQSGSLLLPSRRIVRCARQVFHFLITLPLFASLHALASDMPTAEDMAEMQKMMESMQEQMQNLDPQTRAAMDAAMNQSMPVGDDLALPPKSPRLARLQTAPLQPAALKDYVDTIAKKMDRALSPQALKRARAVEAEVKKQPDAQDALRAAANGLAAMGAWPEATYLMAQLARRSGQTEDLSNLGAFLTLMHAAPAALPILHTLDARYPQNSTLLNNLGQAYFQLGDIDRAERYLVAAVQRSPRHPQANLTRAVIQQSRGDRSAAQQSLERALEGGYSKTKQEQLEKTGNKWRPKAAWRGPMPQDPLGLEKITVPPYPGSVAELPGAVSTWDNFRTLLRARIDELEMARNRNLQKMESMSQSQMLTAAMSVTGMPFKEQAVHAMNAEGEHFQIALDKHMAALAAARLLHADALQKLQNEIDALRAANERKYARSAALEEKHKCDGVPDAYTKYLNTTRNELETVQRAYLETMRRHANEQAYLSQFVQPTATMLEGVKLTSQLQYTQAMLDLVVPLGNLSVGDVPECLNKPVKMRSIKLPDYNDIRCEYISKLEFPGIGSMSFRCDKTDVSLAPVMAPFEVAWSSKYTGKGDEQMLLRASAAVSAKGVKVGGFSEFDEGGFKKGGINVGVSTDLGPKVNAGPLEVGNSVSVTGSLEFDRNGISDVGVEAGVKSKISSTPVKTEQGGQINSEVEAGLKSSWSWNSGVNGSVSQGFDSSVLDL